MEFLNVLSREEMKNVKGGSPDCVWSSCGTAASYYNCLTAKCGEWYSGQDHMDCANTVGQAHINMIAHCNLEYQ